MKRLTEEKRRSLMIVLKAAYDAIASEPIPQNMDALVRRMK